MNIQEFEQYLAKRNLDYSDVGDCRDKIVAGGNLSEKEVEILHHFYISHSGYVRQQIALKTEMAIEVPKAYMQKIIDARELGDLLGRATIAYEKKDLSLLIEKSLGSLKEIQAELKRRPRIAKIIKNGSFLSFYVFEPNDGSTVHVSYDQVSTSVLCLLCQREEPCRHINFLQYFFDEIPSSSLARLIADCTSWMPSPEFIGTMKRGFDTATSRKLGQSWRPPEYWAEYLNSWDVAQETEISNPKKKPRTPPSPFSLVELE